MKKWNFDHYDAIVLDASVMFHKLNDEMTEAIRMCKSRIQLPATFEVEARQVYEVANERCRNNYIANWKNLSLSPLFSKTSGLEDTYAHTVRIAAADTKTLVILANYSLLDRLVFHNIRVDIFNLYDNARIPFSRFSSLRKDSALHKDTGFYRYREKMENDVIFSARNAYVLEKEEGRGGLEANIYSLKGKPDVLVKLYKENYDTEDCSFLSKEKLENILKIAEANQTLKLDWLASPLEVVYAEKECRTPIGYLMRRYCKEEVRFLSDVSLFFNGSVTNKFPENRDRKVYEVLNLCIRMVREFLFLNYNDIHVSDFNDKNFAVRRDGMLCLVDTDSFNSEDYRSSCFSHLGMLDGRLTIKDKKDLIEVSYVSLYAFVFSLLSLDTTFFPLSSATHSFRLSKEAVSSNLHYQAKWAAIPKTLQKFFVEVFQNNSLPGPGVLLAALEEVGNDPVAKKSYMEFYRALLDPRLFVREEPKKPANSVTPVVARNVRHTSNNSKKAVILLLVSSLVLPALCSLLNIIL